MRDKRPCMQLQNSIVQRAHMQRTPAVWYLCVAEALLAAWQELAALRASAPRTAGPELDHIYFEGIILIVTKAALHMVLET